MKNLRQMSNHLQQLLGPVSELSKFVSGHSNIAEWACKDVQSWVRLCSSEFGLCDVNADKFVLNGKALLMLSKQDFNTRVPNAGDVMYNVLHAMLKVAFSEQEQQPIWVASQQPAIGYSTVAKEGAVNVTGAVGAAGAMGMAALNGGQQRTSPLRNGHSDEKSDSSGCRPDLDGQMHRQSDGGLAVGSTVSTASTVSTVSPAVTISAPAATTATASLTPGATAVCLAPAERSFTQGQDSSALLHTQQAALCDINMNRLKTFLAGAARDQTRAVASFFNPTDSSAFSSEISPSTSPLVLPPTSCSQIELQKMLIQENWAKIQAHLAGQILPGRAECEGSADAARRGVTPLAETGETKMNGAQCITNATPPLGFAAARALRGAAASASPRARPKVKIEEVEAADGPPSTTSAPAPLAPPAHTAHSGLAALAGLATPVAPSALPLSTPFTLDACVLWNFLNRILDDPAYREYAEWIDHERWTFRINQTEELAQLWGRQKNKKNMTYEKMARALRYYYKSGIMRKVPKLRLTFQFLMDPHKIPRGFPFSKLKSMGGAGGVAAGGKGGTEVEAEAEVRMRGSTEDDEVEVGGEADGDGDACCSSGSTSPAAQRRNDLGSETSGAPPQALGDYLLRCGRAAQRSSPSVSSASPDASCSPPAHLPLLPHASLASHMPTVHALHTAPPAHTSHISHTSHVPRTAHTPPAPLLIATDHEAASPVCSGSSSQGRKQKRPLHLSETAGVPKLRKAVDRCGRNGCHPQLLLALANTGCSATVAHLAQLADQQVAAAADGADGIDGDYRSDSSSNDSITQSALASPKSVNDAAFASYRSHMQLIGPGCMVVEPQMPPH